MIKKLFPLSAALIFAFSILFISIEQATLGAKPGLAAASIKISVSPLPEATTSATTLESTPLAKEYVLPYPGILPDNPIYKIKMVRDRLWLWLTTDQVPRTSLLLLYADKRLGAGQALIEGNKVALGIDTLTKGEKYLERAIAEAQKAKENGKEISSVSDKLKEAVPGHRTLLSEIKEKLNAEGQEAVGNLIKMNQLLQEKADQL